MSNETLQEKHPKFYESPHLWIGAIEVEVNCDTTGTYRQIKKGEIFQLSALTLHEFQSMSALQNLTPKFEPQEGEQLIKDLESAVSAGAEMQLEYVAQKYGYYWLEVKNIVFPFGTIKATVKCDNISRVTYSLDYSDTETVKNFDTAAYVTTLLKLGYYL
jgi:hypothetical protein